jgi:hypothetical protein
MCGHWSVEKEGNTSLWLAEGAKAAVSPQRGPGMLYFAYLMEFCASHWLTQAYTQDRTRFFLGCENINFHGRIIFSASNCFMILPRAWSPPFIFCYQMLIDSLTLSLSLPPTSTCSGMRDSYHPIRSVRSPSHPYAFSLEICSAKEPQQSTVHSSLRLGK